MDDDLQGHANRGGRRVHRQYPLERLWRAIRPATLMPPEQATLGRQDDIIPFCLS